MEIPCLRGLSERACAMSSAHAVGKRATWSPAADGVSRAIQIVLLAAGAAYFGWTAAGALRSGEISVYVRANRDRHLSRRANPAGYWIAVSWYLLLAMVAAAGVVIRSFWG
jgi:hypothetical protein